MDASSIIVIVFEVLFAGSILLAIFVKLWVIFVKSINATHGNKQEDRHEDELADWAKSKGLTLHSGKDNELYKRYCFFDCLQQGENQYAYNIMEGTINNRKVCAFDYSYQGSAFNTRVQHFESGNSSCTITHSNMTFKTVKPNSFSAVILETDLHFKPLVIRAENSLDKVRLHKQESADSLETRALNKVFTSSRVFGLHGISPATMFQESGVLPDGKITDSPRSNDIDFESTEFNNQFHVSAHDRKWAYDVLNQKNMDLLLNSCCFNIEFHDNSIIAYRNELFSPAYFEEALNLINGILDNLSESLIQELKGSGK